MKTPSLTTLAAAVVALLALGACADLRIEARQGYMPDQGLIEKVRPGVHDLTSVRRLLGAPATKADFNGQTWIYVTRYTRRVAFLPEDVISQQVLTIKFDDIGVVKELKQFSLKDGKKVEMLEDTTPTHGSELTILQQLLGNLGRFNTTEEE